MSHTQHIRPRSVPSDQAESGAGQPYLSQGPRIVLLAFSVQKQYDKVVVLHACQSNKLHLTRRTYLAVLLVVRRGGGGLCLGGKAASGDRLFRGNASPLPKKGRQAPGLPHLGLCMAMLDESVPGRLAHWPQRSWLNLLYTNLGRA